LRELTLIREIRVTGFWMSNVDCWLLAVGRFSWGTAELFESVSIRGSNSLLLPGYRFLIFWTKGRKTGI
jgi:hypothetical protein